MKHVLLTLLVAAASTYAGPILADIPAPAPEEASTDATLESSSDLSSDVISDEEVQPEYRHRWWSCTAVSFSPYAGPSIPFFGSGPGRYIAANRALRKCQFSQPYFGRNYCYIQECHPFPY